MFNKFSKLNQGGLKIAIRKMVIAICGIIIIIEDNRKLP